MTDGSIADRTEILQLLTDLARSGGVIAARTLLAELEKDAAQAQAPEPEPPASTVIDSLAARRLQAVAEQPPDDLEPDDLEPDDLDYEEDR